LIFFSLFVYWNYLKIFCQYLSQVVSREIVWSIYLCILYVSLYAWYYSPSPKRRHVRSSLSVEWDLVEHRMTQSDDSIWENGDHVEPHTSFALCYEPKRWLCKSQSTEWPLRNSSPKLSWWVIILPARYRTVIRQLINS